MSAAPSQLFALREMVPEDESFVVYSWLKSYARSQEGRRMRATAPDKNGWRAGEDVLWTGHKPIVERILGRGATVRIAEYPSEKHDGRLILAWACLEAGSPTVIHYILFRRGFEELHKPLVQTLLPTEMGEPCVYSHELVELRGVPEAWQYDPYRR